jgi:hypothetical protein
MVVLVAMELEMLRVVQHLLTKGEKEEFQLEGK